ncbi:hypothetical protein L3X37_09040 [Sabulilitoribacter arenilitoris]|uniref:Uncharacterized protein n=1 Tax=Wocania arenilitoris TaxID=2044858 RepID=A0AAE3JKU8_9FLAO|nr:hypothetical protein [Wocania arenilitoris]MCF7568508.1 hypothetical protein [Wocania arenilitoris]
MKYNFISILLLLIFSCGKEKVILLPEITHSETTDIKDVSAAYLFYDETQKDSVELNRKNLISTTNWLVNVDKRLTLKQAIPHIKFLQEKKRNSSHINENAKNYFTCSDISRQNLGFIEFTDVYYNKKHIVNVLADNYSSLSNKLIINIESLNDIKINSHFNEINITHSNSQELNQDIKSLSNNKKNTVMLFFGKNLLFQDYITIKSIISKLNLENITISNNEFIY